MVIFSKEKSFFQLSVEQKVPEDISTVFNFFETPKNLNLITPPWLNFKIIPPVPKVVKKVKKKVYFLFYEFWGGN